MIIDDLSYLTTIAERENVSGGERQLSYDNRGLAVARSYARGSRTYAVSGTSVYLDRGVSQAQSFSWAEASDQAQLTAENA